MSLRRIAAGDVALLRELRLRALRADPLSFGSTYAGEAARDGWFERWATEHAAGCERATFLALAGGEAAGLAGGFAEDGEPGVYQLFSMWVAPEHRRAGHGRRLIEAVAGWAADCGGRELRLWVTDQRAAALYETSGFARDGRIQPLPHAPEVTEIGMARRLAGTA